MKTKRKTAVRKKMGDARRKKLRAEYDVVRGKRDILIGIIKKRRQELARYTFADLDSRGKNPYFKSVKGKEKRLTKEYYKLDNRLNKIDHLL